MDTKAGAMYGHGYGAWWPDISVYSVLLFSLHLILRLDKIITTTNRYHKTIVPGIQTTSPTLTVSLNSMLSKQLFVGSASSSPFVQ